MSHIHWSICNTLRTIVVAAFTTFAAVSWSSIVRADAVTDWNVIAVQALVAAAPPRPGPVIFLDLAIVQAAVHDAVQAFEKRFEPYHVNISDASGSPIAAVATAARDVLIDIVPSQTDTLNTQYEDYLASQGLLETDPGVAVGQQAADGILDLRDDDGRVPDPLPPPFTGGTAPGEWRPTPSLQPGPPPSNAPMATPWLGSVPPFTLKSGDQYSAKAPPRLTSKRYAEDYNEVKALGVRANSARTPEQEQLAYFYAGNNFILWIRVLREVAAANTNNLGDNARLLALGTLAIADAFITCWADKIHYVFWRPITAIREGENDGNTRTMGDANWEPLLNTPNYPDYTSGANNAVGALTRTLELFFGTDRITFTAVSQHPLAVPNTLTYQQFSDLSWDTVDVRIYQGIHFRTADEEGRKQGRSVAKWVFKHFLRPVKK